MTEETFTPIGETAVVQQFVLHRQFPFAEVDIGHRKVRHHEPGVYIGLPDESYFQDPALGSSDIKRLLVSAPDYWDGSLYNPKRQPDGSRYLDRGHGLHALLLMGETFFRDRYVRRIQKEDYPAALITMDDLKKALRDVGGAVSGRKEELIARLKEFSTRYTIWDDLVAAQEREGKVILEADDYDRILIADYHIRMNPKLQRCFRNGIPEVAIFWEQDGVRFRSKLDYLSTYATADLKSFTNKLRRPVSDAINMAFWGDRHDLQASLYLNARVMARELVAQGRVFGEVDREWLARVVNVENDVFALIYHQLSGAVVTRGKFVRRGGYVDGAASVKVAHAADIWRENFKRFGLEFWVDMSEIDEVTEDDAPGWVRW
jgi:hypothetical protein